MVNISHSLNPSQATKSAEESIGLVLASLDRYWRALSRSSLLLDLPWVYAQGDTIPTLDQSIMQI